MQESFLHYIWQMQYFNKRELLTTAGERIEIFRQGILNTNAGPDFSSARIRIGSMDWVGSVEIHTHASGWLEHHHETDKGYENVILHVVWENNKVIQRSDHTLMPTLELRGRVDESLIRTYRQLTASSFSIPCQKSLHHVPLVIRLSMVEKALVRRLEQKSMDVLSLLKQNGNDWEQTTYQILARNFGFKINADPFFQLTQSLHLKILLKHADRQSDLEALLFGQGGFLDGRKGDEYYQKLCREYRILGRKYDLVKVKMSRTSWKFLRLRPANFPTLRLAQFGAIFFHKHNLFSSLLYAEDKESLTDLLVVEPSSYWRTHYRFSKKTNKKTFELGQSAVENIIINTVVPIWVAYGQLQDDPVFMEKSLRMLQQLPAEENRITKMWQDHGMPISSSFDSQGLIELYNHYCSFRSCLSCNIGASLIRPT